MKNSVVSIFFIVFAFIFTGCDGIKDWIAEDIINEYNQKIVRISNQRLYFIRENKKLKRQIISLKNQKKELTIKLESTIKNNTNLEAKLNKKKNNLKKMFN